MSDDISKLGVPTFFTRVEAWECDHNQHWNVRQYMRVFQMAGYAARDMAVVPTQAPFTQLTRFHRELVQTAPVEVRSAVLSDGPFAGYLVHLLSSEGRLAATALEGPAIDAPDLPQVLSDQVPAALPRGLDAAPHPRMETLETGSARVIEHGFVQPREADHTGALSVDCLMGRIAAATNDRLSELGFNPAFVREHKISRMGIESSITIYAPIPVGRRLRSTARIVRAEGKNIVVRHSIFDTQGRAMAASDQSLLTVDMTTRKSCPLPDVIMGKVDEG